jgi:hypothetical protein
MTKTSLYAAALAFMSFTALPALADSTSLTPPAATPAQGTVQSDAHKAAEKPADKTVEKVSKDAKDAKVSTDSGDKTAPVTK